MLLNSKTCRELCALASCALFIVASTAATSAVAAQESATTAATAPATEELRAIFIDVNGNVRWRSNAEAPWQAAKVNDVVNAGAEVSTGLRSRAALRVGRNATILLDSGTALSLPTILQDGDVLRTTASVKTGRADFKVDKVGLSNDFRVVTPSTTLAVKGTEFAVATGALKQMEIVGARRNVINAIELKYALNNQTVNLSGGASSSNDAKNPTHAAVLATAVPSVAGTVKDSGNGAVKDAVSGPAPVESGSSSQAANHNSSSHRTEAQDGETENSVTAAMLRAIALANARTDRALDYLIHAAEYADIVEAQSDVLAALRQLADARKAEALASLAVHQNALNAAQLARANAKNAQNSLGNISNQLTSNLNSFNSQRDAASALLAQIESILTQEGCGDVQSLAHQATAALMGMNGALADAQGNLQGMAQNLAAVNAILASMDLTTRPQAAAAVAAYQSAMLSLQQLAAAGASPAQIAAAAQAAAAQLQGLISQLAGLAQTQGAIAAAQQALQVLANANTALAQSQAMLAAIQAARDAATSAGQAAQLGMVEQLYQQIVAIRAAMASSLLAQAGLTADASEGAVATNSYAEGIFALLGNYWRDETLNHKNDAAQHASAAAAADAAAGVALNDFNSAVGQAQNSLTAAQANFAAVQEGAQGVTTAHVHLDTAAGQAMDALNNIATLGHAGMEAALAALNTLESALGQIVAQYANLQGVAGQQPSSAELAAIQAQGAAALQAMMDAIAAAQAAGAAAGNSASQAANAAAAAETIQNLALQLAQTYGLNMEGALAAAAQAYQEAAAAAASGGAAANSSQHAQALALLAQANAIGDIGAQIDAMLAQSGNLSEAALAELLAAQNTYVSVNEFGAEVFADLSEGTAEDALSQQLGAQSAMNSLQEMTTMSTQYVAALDGAEGAARGAEMAAKGARRERVAAEHHKTGAEGAFSQMNRAISNGNWGAANSFLNHTVSHAGASNTSANNSMGYANSASGYYGQAVHYEQVANQLQSGLAQYGSSAAEFQANAAAYADTVNGANQAMADISARAQFYDSVAQMLAGRANTDPAFAAALRSGDAQAQVVAIAAQLAESAQNAAVMEQVAGSNAQRMFYRSARQYVERAGAAAQNALRDAQRARAAADQAAQIAAQAQQTAGSGAGQ